MKHQPDADNLPVIGLYFQEGTKFSRGQFPPYRLDYLEPAGRYKEYPENLGVRELSQVSPTDRADLWHVIHKRRSRRNYTGLAIPFPQLESLLWATQGETARRGEYRLRTAPSAGALYPTETYIYAHEIDSLDRGLYHLNVKEWRLEWLKDEDLSYDLARAALDQPMVSRASATFIWTAHIGRCAQKYGQRAYRYIYLDAAHVAAHLYLAAEALDFGCCGIAALYDEEVNELIGVDGLNETVVYMATVGPVRD